MSEIDIEDVRLRTDRSLRDFLQRTKRRFAEMDPGSAALVDELIRLVTAGGKRVRPTLCFLGYRAVDPASCEEELLRAASSLELLHTFAILHDDIMDESPYRRGEPSTFRRVAQEARMYGSGTRPDLLGVSVSMLAGDLAFALSDELFWDSGFEATRLASAAPNLTQLRLEALAGQYLDVVNAGSAQGRPEEALTIARLKTAGYTIRGPLLVGAALATGSVHQIVALSAFGTAVGEAFQIRDDIIGVFGDPKTTGKDAVGDMRMGKTTTLIANALESASAPDRQILESEWGNPAADTEGFDRARAAIRRTGAVQILEDRIERLVSDAKSALRNERAMLQPGAIRVLDSLADSLVSPNSS